MKKILLLLFLMAYSTHGIAVSFGCKTYFNKTTNTLGGVEVFNADYIGDKYTAVLAPTNQIESDNIITQFWDLKPYRDTKLFVSCIYENDSKTIIEIPITVNTCKLQFADDAKKAKPVKTIFICF